MGSDVPGAAYNLLMRKFLIAGLLGSLLALSGCGLKGDLYRPPPKPAAAPPATQPAPAGAPADEDTKDANGEKPAPKPQ